MFDSFYIDKNSNYEFDLNFKEITLDFEIKARTNLQLT